jgi:deoxyribose-phosphate aldolase
LPRTPGQLAALIDHTLLRADAARPEIVKLCEESVRYGFASVCVNPWWVKTAVQVLRRAPVRVAAAVGFPFGAAVPRLKAAEALAARRDGADELDMVLNLGAFRSGDSATALRDIRGVVRAAGRGTLVKVILETACLTGAEKVRACRLAERAGAHFVKTSTGFGPGGATVRDVRLLRRAVGERLGVKAAGGIRDTETALAMLRAGASRIGASASVKIVEGYCWRGSNSFS